jgi:hypothetical protein
VEGEEIGIIPIFQQELLIQEEVAVVHDLNLAVVRLDMQVVQALLLFGTALKYTYEFASLY